MANCDTLSGGHQKVHPQPPGTWGTVVILNRKWLSTGNPAAVGFRISIFFRIFLFKRGRKRLVPLQFPGIESRDSACIPGKHSVVAPQAQAIRSAPPSNRDTGWRMQRGVRHAPYFRRDSGAHSFGLGWNSLISCFRCSPAAIHFAFI